MTWTREPPKVEGFYWLRNANTDPSPIVMHVWRRYEDDELASEFSGSDETFQLDDWGPDAEWYGPLEPPA